MNRRRWIAVSGLGMMGMASPLRARAADPPPPGPLPIAAHNCYLGDTPSNARLLGALTLGIDNIEIDLGWDADRAKLIVGHDASPRPGIRYPDLETYLIPTLQEYLKRSPTGRLPSVLTFDWKTSEPAAVLQFKELLETHRDWFSEAPKSDPSPLTVRKLTACLSGDQAAKAEYDRLIPDGGTYRAFADRVHGAADYREDVRDYAAEPATPFRRFLSFHWSVIEQGAPPLAGDWTDDEEARLKELVGRCHEKGYRIRVYCLNGKSRANGEGYLFPTMNSAARRWEAAADAGVDWIATDDYGEIVRHLRARARGV